MTTIASITHRARDLASGRGLRDVAFTLMLVATATFALPLAAHAQGAPLDRVQNLITTGRFTDASNALERWEREFADPRSDAPAAERARALYLRGVLTTDSQEAEDVFVGVVLSYPSSAVAPDALLRLGQGLLTNGNAERAVAYLERLRSDYPGTDARETGMLWLARAQLAMGSARAACETSRAGAAATSDPNLAMLLDIEQDRACGAGQQPAAVDSRVDSRPDLPTTPTQTPPRVAARDAARDAPPPVTAPPVTEPPRTESTVPPPAAVVATVNAQQRAAAETPAGDFAVQTAAFRELRSAHVIAGQMRKAGLDVRVVSMDGSDIYRVRTGVFTTAGDAAATMQRVRAAGFAALLVNDVRYERLVRDPPRW